MVFAPQLAMCAADRAAGSAPRVGIANGCPFSPAKCLADSGVREQMVAFLVGAFQL